MQNITYSPGPRFTEAEPDDSYYQISDDMGTSLAQVEAWDGDKGEELMNQAKANACLIAAAPVMLEALRLAQSALNTAPRFTVGDTDSYKIAAKVDAAIQAANTGEPTTAESDDILDDLFHGCAFAAFVEQTIAKGGPPDQEATRRRSYRYYEEALAAKNRRQD